MIKISIAITITIAITWLFMIYKDLKRDEEVDELIPPEIFNNLKNASSLLKGELKGERKRNLKKSIATYT